MKYIVFDYLAGKPTGQEFEIENQEQKLKAYQEVFSTDKELIALREDQFSLIPDFLAVEKDLTFEKWIGLIKKASDTISELEVEIENVKVYPPDYKEKKKQFKAAYKVLYGLQDDYPEHFEKWQHILFDNIEYASSQTVQF